MGGFGSGGHNRIKEGDRKKTTGGRTDAGYDQRRAEKVVAGPWLPKIPDPEIPLGQIGDKKYRELAAMLFEQNKLTSITALQAELAARQFEKIAMLQTQGKYPSASDVNQLQRALSALRIAEEAKNIGQAQGRINKFAKAGFSNRRSAAR